MRPLGKQVGARTTGFSSLHFVKGHAQGSLLVEIRGPYGIPIIEPGSVGRKIPYLGTRVHQAFFPRGGLYETRHYSSPLRLTRTFLLTWVPSGVAGDTAAFLPGDAGTQEGCSDSSEGGGRSCV